MIFNDITYALESLHGGSLNSARVVTIPVRYKSECEPNERVRLIIHWSKHVILHHSNSLVSV